jgi:elongation factor 1-alpha
MSLPKINLVVIGHKDHGKSTLIGRLLYDSNVIPKQKLQEIKEESKRLGKKGFKFHFLLDSLEEERKGGLTIDIMQTPFKTKKYLYTIIDCPGHREFIKNMITGASQADAAILVVSAKEGIQDQTKQHAFLTKTFGIEQLVIAVNKMDEVNYSEEKFKKISEKLRKVLISLGYEKVPIVPVSALNGDNVLKRSKKFQWYDGLTLIETLDETINPSTLPTSKPLRAFVQDVYELKKERIIICKIETGNLESGREVIFEPSGEKGIVKRIEMFGKEIERGEPGDSIGLIVSGIKKIERGDVISYPEKPAKPVNSFVAEIILFSDVTIRNNDIQTIRYGTAEKKCKVAKILEKIDPVNLTLQEKFPDMLKDGDVGKVMFSAVEPICLERYSEIPQLGRFVIEGKRGATAAGIVLELEE